MGPKRSRSSDFTPKTRPKKKTKRPSRKVASKSRSHQVSLTSAGGLVLPDAADHGLRDIRKHLKRAVSTTIVVIHALREQNVELDDDAADTLQYYVSDMLFDDVLRINRLLGEREEDDDDNEFDIGAVQ